MDKLATDKHRPIINIKHLNEINLSESDSDEPFAEESVLEKSKPYKGTTKTPNNNNNNNNQDDEVDQEDGEAVVGQDEEDGEEEEEEEYVVEAIRDWRWNLREKQREYLIKWKGYSEGESTWEPEDNLNCPHILQRYIESLSTKRYRYWSTQDPQDLSGFQRNAVFQGCVGADKPHDSDDDENLDSQASDKKEKQKFYCLVLFEDSDYAEDVTIREFMHHKPDEAWKWLEQRMFFSKKPTK